MKCCAECGKLLPEGSKHNRLYCSRVCADKARNRRQHRKKVGVPKCVVCGAEITQPGRYRYCSEECYRKGWKASHRKEPEMKICVECGAEFETVYSRQITCSAECRAARQRKIMAVHNGLRKFHKDRPRIRGMENKTRFCHDCGKPTNNYRCDECWEKFRTAREME